MLREARKSCTELAMQIPCYFPSIPAVDSEGIGGGGGGYVPLNKVCFLAG